MIDESQLGGKKTLKKTVSRRQQKKTEKKRINITCGEEDETAYTTISTWPFMYSFWSPLTITVEKLNSLDSIFKFF